ncbi:hypothetical protein WG66_007521 [Moniliophthora roreri]|nr:hypothetical protein WG66_007521 [Moniliophthora roreri]
MGPNYKKWFKNFKVSFKRRGKVVAIQPQIPPPNVLPATPMSTPLTAAQTETTELSSALPINSSSTPVNAIEGKASVVDCREPPPDVLPAAPTSTPLIGTLSSTQTETTELSSALPIDSPSTPVGAVEGRVSAVLCNRLQSYVSQARRSTSMIRHQFNGPTMFANASRFIIEGGIFNNIDAGGFSTVTIIDAAGRNIPFPAGIPACQESIESYLKWQFHHQQDKISEMLLEFITQGQYSLSIDEGRQVVILGRGEENWSRVVSGTTIVMSAILWQEKQSDYSAGYKCPICKTWNSNMEEGLNVAKDCCNPKCPGRFQAIEEGDSGDQQNKDMNMDILRNIHIMQGVRNSQPTVCITDSQPNSEQDPQSSSQPNSEQDDQPNLEQNPQEHPQQ